jgi:hypothetical protein
MAPSPLVVNNTALLQHIVEEEAIARSPNHLHITPHPRQSTLSSTPILARRLPPLSYLLQIALQECKSSQHSHILSESLATALQTPLDAYPVPPDDRPPPREGSPHDERRQYFSEMKGGQAYEGFQVLRAIEKKNVMLLMEIRTQQFELLLQPVGGSTPLVHAMRLGESRECRGYNRSAEGHQLIFRGRPGGTDPAHRRLLKTSERPHRRGALRINSSDQIPSVRAFTSSPPYSKLTRFYFTVAPSEPT